MIGLPLPSLGLISSRRISHNLRTPSLEKRYRTGSFHQQCIILSVLQLQYIQTKTKVFEGPVHRFSFENAANSILRYTVYMESTNIGDTVYFTKSTVHSKMRYSLIFSLSEHIKHRKLHSQCEKKTFFNVLCVL